MAARQQNTRTQPSQPWFQRFQAPARALRHRNFRLFIGAHFLSVVGIWMQMTAQAWLVYRLTHSPSMLGVVAFVGQIWTLLMAPVAGVVADRFNRRWFLIAMAGISALLSITLAVLTITGAVKPWHILVLAMAVGGIGVFDNVARQSFQKDMVGKEDLVSAISLVFATFNLGRIVGPVIAGVLAATIGEGWCFAANGVCFLSMITGLLLMRMEPQARKEPSRSFQEFREGCFYVWNNVPSRLLLLLLVVCGLMNYPLITTLMPLFAHQILHGGPETMGILIGSIGVGAILGSIYTASRTEAKTLSQTIAFSVLLYGAALIVFSFSGNMYLSMLVLALAGGGMAMQGTATNTSLQTIAPEYLRGRVVGFFGMIWWGFAAIGDLMAGFSSHLIGPRYTLAIGSSGCILAALAFQRRQWIVRDTLARHTEQIVEPAAPPALQPELPV